MFENTSKKIKICAYIFFIGSLLNQGTQTFRQWVMLGSPSDLLLSTITGTFLSMIGYFIIALIIYSFGKIVEHFEETRDAYQDVKVRRDI